MRGERGMGRFISSATYTRMLFSAPILFLLKKRNTLSPMSLLSFGFASRRLLIVICHTTPYHHTQNPNPNNPTYFSPLFSLPLSLFRIPPEYVVILTIICDDDDGLDVRCGTIHGRSFFIRFYFCASDVHFFFHPASFFIRGSRRGGGRRKKGVRHFESRARSCTPHLDIPIDKY